VTDWLDIDDLIRKEPWGNRIRIWWYRRLFR
jgi:hypothetical protein